MLTNRPNVISENATDKISAPSVKVVVIDVVVVVVVVVVVESSHKLSQFLQPTLQRSSSQTHMLNETCKVGSRFTKRLVRGCEKFLPALA